MLRVTRTSGYQNKKKRGKIKKETNNNTFTRTAKRKIINMPPRRFFRGSDTLTIALLFLTLFGVRTYYTLTLPILDCDETFNYWEPAFALLQQDAERYYNNNNNGNSDTHPASAVAESTDSATRRRATSSTPRVLYYGKQTWEYAPQFALRSWLFLWLYAWPGVAVRRVATAAYTISEMMIQTRGGSGNIEVIGGDENGLADGVAPSSTSAASCCGGLFSKWLTLAGEKILPVVLGGGAGGGGAGGRGPLRSLLFSLTQQSSSSFEDRQQSYVNGQPADNSATNAGTPATATSATDTKKPKVYPAIVKVRRNAIKIQNSKMPTPTHDDSTKPDVMKEESETEEEYAAMGSREQLRTRSPYTFFTSLSPLSLSSSIIVSVVDGKPVLDTVFIFFVCKLVATFFFSVAEMFFIVAVGKRFGGALWLAAAAASASGEKKKSGEEEARKKGQASSAPAVSTRAPLLVVGQLVRRVAFTASAASSTTRTSSSSGYGFYSVPRSEARRLIAVDTVRGIGGESGADADREDNSDDGAPPTAAACNSCYSLSIVSPATYLAFLIVTFSSGTVATAVSFLPSSFAAMCYYAALGAWLWYDSEGRCGNGGDDEDNNGGTKRSRSLLTFSLLPRSHSSALPSAMTHDNNNNGGQSVARVMFSDGKSAGVGGGSSVTRRAQELVEQRRAEELKSDFVATVSSYRLLAGVIVPVIASVVVGWPFAGLISVPIALDVLYCDGLIRPLLVFFQSFIVLGGAVLAVDSFYYQRLVWTPWQLVAYNVFGGAERGPELYGIEPWNFFFKNLALNFNLAFVVALVAPLLVLLAPRSALATPSDGSFTLLAGSCERSSVKKNEEGRGKRDVTADNGDADEAVARRLAVLKAERAREKELKASIENKKNSTLFPKDKSNKKKEMSVTSDGVLISSSFDVIVVPPVPLTRLRQVLYMSPFFLWFIFWMRIPHKEERFMAPAYPFLVLTSVIGLLTALRCANAAMINLCRAGISSGGVENKKSSPSFFKKAVSFVLRLTARTTSVCALFVVVLAPLLSQLRLLAIVDNYSGLQSAAISTRRAISAMTAAHQSQHRGHAAVTATAASASKEEKKAHATDAKKERNQPPLPPRVKTLCVGVDWYRYPSSFFLPPPTFTNSESRGSPLVGQERQAEQQQWRYCFLKTKAFDGALPLDFKYGLTKSKNNKKKGHDASFTRAAGVVHSSDVVVDHESSSFISSFFLPAAPRKEMNDLNREVLPIQYCGGEGEDVLQSDGAGLKRKGVADREGHISKGSDASSSSFLDSLHQRALAFVCDAVMDTSGELLTTSELTRTEKAGRRGEDDNTVETTSPLSRWSVLDGGISSESVIAANRYVDKNDTTVTGGGPVSPSSLEGDRNDNDANGRNKGGSSLSSEAVPQHFAFSRLVAAFISTTIDDNREEKETASATITTVTEGILDPSSSFLWCRAMWLFGYGRSHRCLWRPVIVAVKEPVV